MNVSRELIRIAKSIKGVAHFSFRDFERTLGTKALHVTYKDYKRICDIIDKSMVAVPRTRHKSVDDAKVLALGRQMANSITDAAKAWRRGVAAEEENYHDLARIFFERANLLLEQRLR